MSLGSKSLRAMLNLLIASYGPINLPFKSVSSIPICLRNLRVLGRWSLVKMVRKPVAMVSADSRVVLLTEVKRASNSVS